MRILDRMIDTLIFDLDGTLVNTLPDLARGVNFSLRQNGFALHTEKEIRSYLGNGSRVLIDKAIGQKVSKSVYDKVFADYLEYYLKHVDIYSHAYEGMKDVLKYFKSRGYKLFVLTNKPCDAARKLCHSVFGDIFDCVLGNTKDIPTKPDLTGFNILKNNYHLNTENICYFGDSDVDMITSHNAQCKATIACAYGYRAATELIKFNPQYVIYSPKEILELDIFKRNS